MSIAITDDLIVSDMADASAARVGPGEWEVSGYPGRKLTRDQAITAMTIAEEQARSEPNWALIMSLESEL